MYFCLFGACRSVFETHKDTRSTREFWWNSWHFLYTLSVASPLKIASFPSIKGKCYQNRMWKWKKNKNKHHCVCLCICSTCSFLWFCHFAHLIPFFLVSLFYPCNNDNTKVAFQTRPWPGKHDTKVNVVNNVMPSHTLSSICMKWTFRMEKRCHLWKWENFLQISTQLRFFEMKMSYLFFWCFVCITNCLLECSS